MDCIKKALDGCIADGYKTRFCGQFVVTDGYKNFKEMKNYEQKNISHFDVRIDGTIS